MKKPTLNGWLAIIGALVALILAAIAALSDGNLSTDEAHDLTDKTGAVIEAVQQATADEAANTPTTDQPTTPEAQP